MYNDHIANEVTMDFSEFKYLWPPRPEAKIPQAMLGHFERLGWVAQTKKKWDVHRDLRARYRGYLQDSAQ